MADLFTVLIVIGVAVECSCVVLNVVGNGCNGLFIGACEIVLNAHSHSRFKLNGIYVTHQREVEQLQMQLAEIVGCRNSSVLLLSVVTYARIGNVVFQQLSVAGDQKARGIHTKGRLVCFALVGVAVNGIVQTAVHENTLVAIQVNVVIMSAKIFAVFVAVDIELDNPCNIIGRDGYVFTCRVCVIEALLHVSNVGKRGIENNILVADDLYCIEIDFGYNVIGFVAYLVDLFVALDIDLALGEVDALKFAFFVYVVRIAERIVKIKIKGLVGGKIERLTVEFKFDIANVGNVVENKCFAVPLHIVPFEEGKVVLVYLYDHIERNCRHVVGSLRRFLADEKLVCSIKLITVFIYVAREGGVREIVNVLIQAKLRHGFGSQANALAGNAFNGVKGFKHRNGTVLVDVVARHNADTRQIGARGVHCVDALLKLGVGKGNDGFKLIVSFLPGGKAPKEKILAHTVVSDRYRENRTRNHKLLDGLQDGCLNIVGGNDIYRASALKANVIARSRENGVADVNGVGLFGVGLRVAVLIVIKNVFAVFDHIAAIGILFVKQTADGVGRLRSIKTVYRIVDRSVGQARNERIARIGSHFAVGKHITAGEAKLCKKILIEFQIRFFKLLDLNAARGAINRVITALLVLHGNGIKIA